MNGISLKRRIEHFINGEVSTIVPFRKRVRVWRQLGLFDHPPGRVQHTVTMGWFYELLTQALWGGKATNNKPMPVFDNNGDSHDMRPDVFGLKSVWESKACQTGHSVNLFDRQINLYKDLQFNHPNKEIYFTIYRHTFRNIRSYRGTEKELFTQLADKTIYNIILPFSIVLNLFDFGNVGAEGYLYRSTQGGYVDCVVARGKLLTDLFIEPIGTMNDLGLETKVFLLDRYMTPQIELDGNKVKGFPVLFIKDKDHQSWVDWFKERELKRVPF